MIQFLYYKVQSSFLFLLDLILVIYSFSKNLIILPAFQISWHKVDYNIFLFLNLL